jgi:1-acyl-sn-glycerol-3-phosphate acyltransferase
VGRFARLTATILAEALLFVLVTVLAPLLLLGAAIADLSLWLARRKPWMGVRIVAFAWWFLMRDLVGLASLGWAWLRTGGPLRGDTPARRRRVYDLQAGWAAGQLAGARRIFGLTFAVEGEALIEPLPAIFLIRHASIIDNALPAALVSRPHGVDLRYVLKAELAKLPTLDIGGHWIPTCFVRRASGDAAAEVARVRVLAEDLGAREGVLVYPEGTRYTPAKLARAQASIAASDPVVGLLAARLHNLLPPRLGGPLALIDEAAGADVVVIGHVGLDGFEYVSDVWSGALVGTTVRVRFWRHPRAEIPDAYDDRVAWLYEVWQELDDWVGRQRLGSDPRTEKAAALR